MSLENKNDGWWISFVLRWGLLFSLLNNYDPLRWLAFSRPGIIVGSAAWIAAHAFGRQIPGGPVSLWSLAADGVIAGLPAFIWTIFDRRSERNTVLREVVYQVVRFTLAAGMFEYGSAKVIGFQGLPQPAPLDWFRPLGEISSRHLMWTWLGYSPSFEFFAGMNESLGAILLLSRRTTLLASLLIFPAMVYVTVLDLTFHVGPVAFRAAYFGVAAFILIAREWPRLTRGFLLRKPIAPASQNKLGTSPRLALVGRGLWIVVVFFLLWRYVIPRFRESADIGLQQSPLCGAYRVERLVSDGHVLSEEAADPARWREVAINWFGDYILIRRMDDSELLWSATAGGMTRFNSAAGRGYNYGDYRKILAKTSGMQGQLTFKELPNYRRPHAGPKAKLDSDQFFTVNFVRNGPDHVSLQGRIDGADISADLVRINNDDFRFFKTREGLP